MLYKLYRVTYKEDVPEKTHFEDFRKFYEENGVTVVGGWANADKRGEMFFMTAYRDMDHYSTFITSMKENTRYQELTKHISE